MSIDVAKTVVTTNFNQGKEAVQKWAGKEESLLQATGHVVSSIGTLAASVVNLAGRVVLSAMNVIGKGASAIGYTFSWMKAQGDAVLAALRNKVGINTAPVNTETARRWYLLGLA